MAVHDTIGDFLTTIRNASEARKESCTTAFSKMRLGIASILKEEGYVADFSEIENAKGHKEIHIQLKYVNKEPALVGIERYSKPGRRLYAGYTNIPRVLGGLGISILTTSKGILKDRDAYRQKVGGEILCRVW